ncbi:DUF2225 domain-containing protein [Bacillus sp. FJAT-49736]|uniref:DUF2225 domain-containing protein n=1 Tax=Bacillus sp. FJAT-49736 TaxID=2833582 RepID=UPI001BC9A6BD|nr:DUF2225 domain-containing protein [Bacillus sp. FJAT-49736]MBS4173939.1 DUF2225 domain-containing protein [Bacillus sp. FJAT-49736]
MDQLSPFYEKSFECYLCKGTFTSLKIRSRFVKVDYYDKDFCPNYKTKELNPVLYNIYVCPHCGFSFSDEFSKHIIPVIKSELIEKVSNHWVHQDFGQNRSIQQAINAYKLASYCAVIKQEKKVTIAGIFLRIAWLYRLLEKEQEQQRFLQIAVQEYKDSYINEDFLGTQMSEMKLLYLIAEILRRTDQYDEAVYYFSKVIEKQSSATERTIVEMARDQWNEMRKATS